MGLSLALDTAISGLKYNGIGMALTSGNVANVSNADYTKKTVSAVATLYNNDTAGVRAGPVQRVLDTFVQRQLRVETSGASYSATRTDMLSRLDSAYGVPGSASAFDTTFNEFSNALQALSTTPDSFISRNQVIASAGTLVDKLGSMSNMVQTLRTDAETALSTAVSDANAMLDQLDRLNNTIRTAPRDTAAYVGFLDQRDAAIGKLTELMDVRVNEQADGSVMLSTTQGTQLLGSVRTRLTFDGRGELSPHNLYDTDTAKRGVGTITTDAGGDLIASGAIRSGKIKALIEMRDQTLVTAQSQLDELAAKVVSAIGTNQVAAPVAATATGAPFGVDMDLGTAAGNPTGLLDGNTITMSVTVNGQKQNFTFMRIDDTTVPVPNTLTADPSDKVVRLTGTTAANFAAQIQTELNTWATAQGAATAPFTASVTTGNTVRLMVDPAVSQAGLSNASANLTASTLSGGSPALPMFLDRGAVTGLYTGAIKASIPQSLGLSQRLQVNPSLTADISKLVMMTPSTYQGDTTRPNFLIDRLNTTVFAFNPATGIGGTTAPYSGTVTGYMRQVVMNQTNMSADAKRLDQGQQQVVKALTARFHEKSNVNMDEEMANLIVLQQAYGANARVMSVTKEMIDTLMKS